MGFLDSGETMTWAEVVEVIDYIKRHGTKQVCFLIFFYFFYFFFLTAALFPSS